MFRARIEIPVIRLKSNCPFRTRSIRNYFFGLFPHRPVRSFREQSYCTCLCTVFIVNIDDPRGYYTCLVYLNFLVLPRRGRKIVKIIRPLVVPNARLPDAVECVDARAFDKARGPGIRAFNAASHRRRPSIQSSLSLPSIAAGTRAVRDLVFGRSPGAAEKTALVPLLLPVTTTLRFRPAAPHNKQCVPRNAWAHVASWRTRRTTAQ